MGYRGKQAERWTTDAQVMAVLQLISIAWLIALGQPIGDLTRKNLGAPLLAASLLDVAVFAATYVWIVIRGDPYGVTRRGAISSVPKADVAERVIDPALATAALSEGNNPLTEREREVLTASLPGASIAAIAGALVLSEGTVRNYLSTAIQKLNARNRVDAARIAEEKGWL